MPVNDYLPECGVYEHYEGGIYRLHLVAFEEATREPVVVYVDVAGGRYWTRPVSSWTELVDTRPGGALALSGSRASGRSPPLLPRTPAYVPI